MFLVCMLTFQSYNQKLIISTKICKKVVLLSKIDNIFIEKNLENKLLSRDDNKSVIMSCDNSIIIAGDNSVIIACDNSVHTK